MDVTELFYPEINVQLGSYSFNSGISIDAFSSKDSYFDWAKVRFTKEYQDKITLAAMDRAVIQLGYNGIFDNVFEGYINKPYSGDGLNNILLKDDMMLLEGTTINNTFLDTTPQEIISYCLTKANVLKSVLSTDTYPAKSRIPIAQKNVIGVINEINTLWGIQNKFYFSGGIFYWGEKPKQDKIYEFEYGSNIISLRRTGGVCELVTVSAPFIKHSQLITISHPQVSGSFEVNKVVFTTSEAGFIRTYIYF